MPRPKLAKPVEKPRTIPALSAETIADYETETGFWNETAIEYFNSLGGLDNGLVTEPLLIVTAKVVANDIREDIERMLAEGRGIPSPDDISRQWLEPLANQLATAIQCELNIRGIKS